MSCTDFVYDERICHMEAVPFVSDIAQFRAAMSGLTGWGRLCLVCPLHGRWLDIVLLERSAFICSIFCL